MDFIKQLKNKINDYLDEQALGDLVYKVKLIARDREELKSWSDRDLKLATYAFRDDFKKGKKLNSMLVPVFAVANEAARRVLDKVPYNEQILAGIVIHQGKVAEMKAGEGKTLTETMPVYLNAITGNGVHIITTNDYLAERDAKEMGKLYDFLGLTTGFVTSTMEPDERRAAYAADITYVTNQEIGFDYLRDNLVFTRKDRVLRPEHPLYFGIVDEVDSILIDESRTPLIIAEPVKEEVQLYSLFTKIVGKLEEDKDYTVDYTHKSVFLTTAGLDRVEAELGDSVFSKDNPSSAFYLDVCLKAKTLFEKDRDYIVLPSGIEIVDEFTGRVLPGRRFTDGVHQAIEAKEKIKVKESDRTVAAVTFQNFFPLYEKLSGMSGTVMDAREEFNTVYKLDVVQIPTHKPMARVEHNDLYFKTQKGKLLGLIKKVKQINKRGQPLLIGARNVESAHAVSAVLNQEALPHQLLTAADHKAEAEKIARAGEEGMITVATNIAGRGTDILLGPGVTGMGGLYVLGTERHESRRIDNQLVGRAGRQGEPGESQFFISMEDEIMQLFGSEKIIDALEQYDIPEDEYISGKGLDDAFRKAQDYVESKNYDSRIYLYKYDSVISHQQKFIYNWRNRLMENEPEFVMFMERSIAEVVRNTFALKDAELIATELRNIFSIEIEPNEVLQLLKATVLTKPSLLRLMNEYLNPFYKEPEIDVGLEVMMSRAVAHLQDISRKLKEEPEVYEASQHLILEIIDTRWSRHLEYMEVLKEESGLFSYASPEPLLDFIREGRQLFEHMILDSKKQFLKSIFLHLSQKGLVN